MRSAPRLMTLTEYREHQETRRLLLERPGSRLHSLVASTPGGYMNLLPPESDKQFHLWLSTAGMITVRDRDDTGIGGKILSLNAEEYWVVRLRVSVARQALRLFGSAE